MNLIEVDMEQLFTTYGAMVFRRCRAIVKEDEVAKDLMQEVFIKVLEKGAPPAPGTSSFLYRIATNLSLNFIRDHKKYAEGDELLLEIASVENLEKSQFEKGWLKRFFNNQSQDTRSMAYMHWVEGFQLAEVAEHFELSISAVRKRLASVQALVSHLKIQELGL